MKNIVHIIIAWLLILSVNSYAIGQTGIYINATDYKSNKLTYENTSAAGKHEPGIRLHNFFGNAPYITVISNGEKHKLKKSELYGFRDRNNEVYRFYKNITYRIAEASNIYIYTQTQNIAQSKGFKVVNVYYFSTSSDGAILPLTFGNLKNAYSNNDKFIDLLDQYFGNRGINEYDKLHKTFKVNYVYTIAMKQ